MKYQKTVKFNGVLCVSVTRSCWSFSRQLFEVNDNYAEQNIIQMTLRQGTALFLIAVGHSRTHIDKTLKPSIITIVFLMNMVTNSVITDWLSWQ